MDTLVPYPVRYFFNPYLVLTVLTDIVYFDFNGDNLKNSASFVELFTPRGNTICAVSFYQKVVTFLGYERDKVH